jgi:aminomethyltransferase
VAEPLRRTPLHDRHVAAGGRMVPFAGWDMPVQYAGVIAEVRAVRERSGLFDISHMGQVAVTGDGAHEFLQGMLSNDLDRIEPFHAQYTLLTNAEGGIVDDLIAYRRPGGRYLLVVNAANTEADVDHLVDRVPRGVDVTDISIEEAMLALQGPEAFAALDAVWEPGGSEGGVERATALEPFGWGHGRVGGVACRVARTGYTGEPGVEFLMAPEDAGRVWDALVEAGATPCGLGARDTLRLEVCYPLHGNDITPDTNAIEAGLGWVCDLDKEFTGVAVLRATREEGPRRRLVAFEMTERGAIPRHGLPIVADDGPVGEVTSGTYSPTLERGIGLGYVPSSQAAPGTPLTVDVRGRPGRAEVHKKPLYVKEP